MFANPIAPSSLPDDHHTLDLEPKEDLDSSDDDDDEHMHEEHEEEPLAVPKDETE